MSDQISLAEAVAFIRDGNQPPCFVLTFAGNGSAGMGAVGKLITDTYECLVEIDREQTGGHPTFEWAMSSIALVEIDGRTTIQMWIRASTLQPTPESQP